MADANSITETMVSELKKYLHYNQDSGLFTWITKTGKSTPLGNIAGCLYNKGYIVIAIHGRRYTAHRMAWAFINGSISNLVQIDHINCIKNDNRIVNLRIATPSENQQNLKRAKPNTSTGLLGVSKKKKGIFQANIMIDGKDNYLGRFKIAQEAHEAYLKAKRELHPFCTI